MASEDRRGSPRCDVPVLVACVHFGRTDQLDQAKDAYAKAEKGPAAQYSPAELATAKKYLEQANDSLTKERISPS